MNFGNTSQQQVYNLKFQLNLIPIQLFISNFVIEILHLDTVMEERRIMTNNNKEIRPSKNS